MRVAERIADAVLYEGYVLYPYRASAAKNHFRWQVGLIVPRAYGELTESDPWFMQTECLAEPGDGARLSVRVRCLQIQERAIDKALDAVGEQWQAVSSLHVDHRQLVAWDEAVVREFVRDTIPLDDGMQERSGAWMVPAGADEEPVHDGTGRLRARIVRRRQAVTSTVRVTVTPCEHLVKIRVRIENVTACSGRTLAERSDVLRQSLAGTHTMLGVDNGAFVSLIEPPSNASELAASCANVHTWPVLVGARGARNVMLSSPIILYDYPSIAPESSVEFCDGTEIDEMLMLRVKTLTDDEKREARATDERAAAIIDRASAASSATMAQLHGAIRPAPSSLAAWQEFLNPTSDPAPEEASIEIGAVRVARGTRVRLQPTHRADAFDICLRGRVATVTGIHTTLEDAKYVAVSLDDDPFAADAPYYRRTLFFHPDEIAPVENDGSVRNP